MQFTMAFLFMLLVLVSCSSCKKTDNIQIEFEEISNIDKNYLEIDVGDYFYNREVINLSKFASKVSYIRLETNENNLIKNIDGLEFEGNFIFIYSFIQGLFQYNNHGEFIRKIGEKGKGPGEYIYLFLVRASRSDFFSRRCVALCLAPSVLAYGLSDSLGQIVFGKQLSPGIYNT